MKKHKRGGIYTLCIMKDVTNWNGVLLDREILNHLQFGDIVRVIVEEYKNISFYQGRYARITEVLKNGYFKGEIYDPYHMRYCNYCLDTGKKGNYLLCCEEECCDFDCHADCLKKHPEIKTCDCKLIKGMFQNDESIVFKKNNISEIPDWSDNTEKLIEIYRNNKNKGYMFTGVR